MLIYHLGTPQILEWVMLGYSLGDRIFQDQLSSAVVYLMKTSESHIAGLEPCVLEERRKGTWHGRSAQSNRLSSSPESVQDLPRVFAEVLRGRVKFLCVTVNVWDSRRLSLFIPSKVCEPVPIATHQRLPSKANSHISALFKMASKTFWPACDGM